MNKDDQAEGFYEGGYDQVVFHPKEQIKGIVKEDYQYPVKFPDMVEGGIIQSGVRKKINDPRIKGPFPTDWGYKDFEDQHDLIGLPNPNRKSHDMSFNYDFTERDFNREAFAWYSLVSPEYLQKAYEHLKKSSAFLHSRVDALANQEDFPRIPQWLGKWIICWKHFPMLKLCWSMVILTLSEIGRHR